MQRSVLYTILFATAICIVCAVVVSSSAVSLKERQTVNATLDKQKNVLYAAGLMDPEEKASEEEVVERFANVEMKVIDLKTGEELPDVDPLTFDQRKEAMGADTSHAAPNNLSRIQRLPDRALVYEVMSEDGSLEGVVLPIEGYGLWGTLYGFLALESDFDTVLGITYYDHKETPGLGGEVDNPSWKAKWPGRRVYDDGEVELTVIKGPAGPPAEDPYEVDGISGATITARGVTNMIHFWLGENGFEPLHPQSLPRSHELMASKSREALIDPLFNDNPIALQVLGICSALAVTTRMDTSLVMSIAVIAVLTFSNLFVSLLRNEIPTNIRIIVQLTIIASLVIVTDQVLKAYLCPTSPSSCRSSSG